MSDVLTDADALLAAILAAPADDGLRLIYADAIEEAEPERAEFIRLQCERCDCSPRSVVRPQCRRCRREAKYMPRYHHQWTRGFWELFPPIMFVPDDYGYVSCPEDQTRHATLIRGLVGEIEIGLHLFLDHAATIFGRHPIIGAQLADRHPLAVSGDRLFCWVNWSVDRMWRMRHQIPPELYALLPDPPDGTLIGVPGMYPSPAIAMSALSAACVAHGRTLAGLPPHPATKGTTRCTR